MSQKYLLIFVGGSNRDLSPEEAEKQMNKWFAWIEKLRSQGKYHSGEALTPGGKVVSNKNGKIVVDGPFTETKEAVGGYFVIEAGNIDEAVAIARDYPAFHLNGKVEVREVRNFDMPR